MSKVLDNEILFARKSDNVIIPSKRDEDGAFDVYAYFEEDYLVIKPHQTLMIPTGLASAFSDTYVAIAKERGSTGSKGIGQRCGVIDSGYRGEWFIPLTNHNDIPLIIMKKDFALSYEANLDEKYGKVVVYPYEKAICQVIMVEVPKLHTREITMDELLSYTSERGSGALGSSDK